MLEQVIELPSIKAPSLRDGLSRLTNLLGGRPALRQASEPFPLDPLNPRELEAATEAIKQHAASVLPPDTPLRFNICTLQASCLFRLATGGGGHGPSNARMLCQVDSPMVQPCPPFRARVSVSKRIFVFGTPHGILSSLGAQVSLAPFCRSLRKPLSSRSSRGRRRRRAGRTASCRCRCPGRGTCTRLMCC